MVCSLAYQFSGIYRISRSPIPRDRALRVGFRVSIRIQYWVTFQCKNQLCQVPISNGHSCATDLHAQSSRASFRADNGQRRRIYREPTDPCRKVDTPGISSRTVSPDGFHSVAASSLQPTKNDLAIAATNVRCMQEILVEAHAKHDPSVLSS